MGTRPSAPVLVRATEGTKKLNAHHRRVDKEKGPGYIRATMKVLDSIVLSNLEREKICWRNAVMLFGLAA
jgi:hypothetical protein